MSLLDFLKQGGPALYPLIFCSVLVVAVVLERIWAFSRVGTAPKELIRRIEGMIAAGQRYEAVNLLDDYESPYARIMKASLTRKDASPEEITDMIAIACDVEIDAVSRPIPILGTIGNIAPFIGLFGTVLGIMHAFRAMAVTNAAGTATVSAGVAEALIATAMGLGIAVIAVVANNWCLSWIDRYRLGLERFSTEWSYRLQDTHTITPKAEHVA